jgi:SAM-dependent MidA family methyltransferase
VVRFSEFFSNWLYAKDGYYANYKAIGKSGDFYTSVSTSKFFGGAIANYLLELIKNKKLPKNSCVVEIGAHKGYLLADMIEFIYTLEPKLLDTLEFVIVEKFDSLQKIQKEYFKESFGDSIKLIHYKNLDEIQKDSGFVVANEIFDAFACELIYNNKMAYIDNFSFVWQEMDNFVKQKQQTYHINKGEIAIGYEEFAKMLKNAFKKSYFVTFDYGQKEIRNDFSIRVYKNHKTYPLFDASLKDFYKMSDITYDVNFSHLIDAFEENNFTNIGYFTQLVALNKFGITKLLEILEKNVPYEAYLQEVGKVKTLLHPSFLGERFKCAIFN